MLFSSTYESPIGILTLVADECRLVGLWLPEQKYFLGSLHELPPFDDNAVLRQSKAWLDRYFDGGQPSPDELPLTPMGSDFRQKVWRILCTIPYGKTMTYGEIARQFSPTMSAQAIGGAVGHNPISIIIPCHRVVGADGSLTGYAGGVDVKRKLLAWEGIL